jgi:hypothetical protein
MYRLMDSDHWAKQIEGSNLSTRAWYVQERLLSPRIIYFGSQQILWECSKIRAMETCPEGGLFGSTYSKTHNPVLQDVHDPERNAWNVVVEVYSRARLTKPEDKAVAVAGLAQLVQNRTGDQYIAGLWKKNFLRQLLWHVQLGSGHNQQSLARPKVYRAPNFLWISIDSAVIMTPYRPLKPVMDVFVAELIELHASGEATNSPRTMINHFVRL